MKIRTSRKGGFTLVEIMIVVAIIGLLASIAIPNVVNARKTAQMQGCISNMHTIDGAKQTWALERSQGPDATPSEDDLKPYLSNRKMPKCPGGGNYTIGSVGVLPSCSLSTQPEKPHVISTD
jgi:prepilin-type N-terminal cleavage/methylation domain-containing protein